MGGGGRGLLSLKNVATVVPPLCSCCCRVTNFIYSGAVKVLNCKICNQIKNVSLNLFMIPSKQLFSKVKSYETKKLSIDLEDFYPDVCDEGWEKDPF